MSNLTLVTGEGLRATRTDHSAEIGQMLAHADEIAGQMGKRGLTINLRAAAALLEVHDATGISLDAWPPVREFVEAMVGHEITPNHA